MGIELPILLLVGALLTAGLYLILDRTLLRVVLGLGLLSNGTHLRLLSTSGLEAGAAPVLSAGTGTVVDPLPQALILTAIVVGVATTAVGLALVVRIREEYGTIEEDEIQAQDSEA